MELVQGLWTLQELNQGMTAHWNAIYVRVVSRYGCHVYFMSGWRYSLWKTALKKLQY